MTKEKISHFFENLNQGTSMESFKVLYHDDVVFKDPFNEVTGISAVHKIFAHMYENLDDPKFLITEYIYSNNVAYIKWDFIFTFKNEKQETSFEGVSRLEMNADGKIISHVDFWDAAEHIYQKIPLLGSLIRLVKKKIQQGK